MNLCKINFKVYVYFPTYLKNNFFRELLSLLSTPEWPFSLQDEAALSSRDEAYFFIMEEAL
jgi:hypothetical protein